MKIFIGTQENCGLIAGLSEGFESLGHHVYTFVKHRDAFFPEEKYNVDLSADSHLLSRFTTKFHSRLLLKLDAKLLQFSKLRAAKNIFNSLPDFDLYIYSWDSILPNLKDIEVLKAKGKRIFFLFVGSDARYAYAFMQQFPTVKLPWNEYFLKEDLNKKLFFLRNIERYCDCIFSVPDQSGLLVKPYMHVYLPLKVSNITYNYPDNDVPVIIHAPSKRDFKGTQAILKSISELQNEGLKFTFKLLENIPNSEVKKELLNADIVIDQIYLSGVGMLGTEALAYGCALATKSKAEFGIKFCPPCWYIDDSHNLTGSLRELIRSRDRRKEIAYKGREYVEKYNEPSAIAKYIENIYTNRITKFDYTPRFFAESFHLPDGYELTDENKVLNWTNLKTFYPYQFSSKSLQERRLINGK